MRRKSDGGLRHFAPNPPYELPRITPCGLRLRCPAARPNALPGPGKAHMPAVSVAQPAGGGALNDRQLLGMRLFNQSCRVCHTKPVATAPAQYGPVLSRDTLGGQEDALRSFISDGTPRMPGFKFSYEPAQIDA